MGQVIFNSTNLIMPHQFIQNKFVQEFVAVSLLFCLDLDKTRNETQKEIRPQGDFQLILETEGLRLLLLVNSQCFVYI